MKFTHALDLMKEGHKVKLPSWGGYWCWNKEKQTIEMHCRQKDSDTDSEVLDIRETQRVEYTLKNVLSDDWMIADERNTPILGGEAAFDFSEALKYLKRGFKLARRNWNAKDQYIYFVDPLNNSHFEVLEKEEMPGTLYPYLAIKTNYNGIVPWLASQTDLLANDWYFVE